MGDFVSADCLPVITTLQAALLLLQLVLLLLLLLILAVLLLLLVVVLLLMLLLLELLLLVLEVFSERGLSLMKTISSARSSACCADLLSEYAAVD